MRPEDIAAAEAANGSVFTFQSEFAEELGPNRLLHGNLGNAPFVVSVASSDHSAPEGTVTLSVPPGKVHLFDIESGRSLRCVS